MSDDGSVSAPRGTDHYDIVNMGENPITEYHQLVLQHSGKNGFEIYAGDKITKLTQMGTFSSGSKDSATNRHCNMLPELFLGHFSSSPWETGEEINITLSLLRSHEKCFKSDLMSLPK